MTQLHRIRDKLEALRRLDAHLQVHGASKHQYQLAPVLPEGELAAFEKEFGVSVPEDYAAFLTTLGNGGAGPSYGFYSLAETVEKSNVALLSTGKTKSGKAGVRLDNPFPLSGAVADALRTGSGDRHALVYVETEYRLDGIMEICHHGCTAYSGLVVCGEQRGKVWATGGPGWGCRWGEIGPGPSSIGFLDWYEGWLDEWLLPGAIERWARVTSVKPEQP